MTLRTIRLELARCHDFPNGSPTHGYEFRAPLDWNGQFDGAEWNAVREKCTVRRFWGRDADETGRLVQHRGHHWAFSYDPTTEDDDEPIFRFDRHVFKEGEYVSIIEHDGVQRTFKVMAVQ